MATVKECSRCGTIYRVNELTGTNTDGEKVVLGTIETPEAKSDLCDGCLTDFASFMQNKKGMVFVNPEDANCGNCANRIARPNPSYDTMYLTDYCHIVNRVTREDEKACSNGKLVGPFWKEKKEDAEKNGRQ